jgi:hypothetical protein
MKKIIGILFLSIICLAGCGCQRTDAEVVSYNLSLDADNFKVPRRIVFFNGITDKYLLEIDGYCSVESTNSRLDGALQVTCKVGNGYKKHYLGLSDNVSYFVEQLDEKQVSVNHYKVIFKPSVIIPDVEVR